MLFKNSAEILKEQKIANLVFVLFGAYRHFCTAGLLQKPAILDILPMHVLNTIRFAPGVIEVVIF